MLTHGWQIVQKKGVWLGHVKFRWASTIIPGTAEARVVKFCTQVGYVK